MSRMFFALWPDDAIRSQLLSVSEKYPLQMGKRVPVENMHITLVFLGQVNPEQEQGLMASTGLIKYPVINLILDTIGWWKKSRILWLGSNQIPEALLQLVASLRESAMQSGIQVNEQDYFPHVTLMRRAKKPAHPANIEPISWRADRFALVNSVTHQSGARYQILKEWRLIS